jgi:surface antigen
LAVRRGNQVLINNSNTSGTSNTYLYYGNASDEVIVGDWNGDGYDTLGVHRGGQFLLSNTKAQSGKSVTAVQDVAIFNYGDSGDKVLVGDWDGNGTDTVGVRRGDTAYLRNSNTSGVANATKTMGLSTDRMLVGDWDGDGYDTLGVQRGNWFALSNRHIGVSGAPVDVSFYYGSSNDVGLVGNWTLDTSRAKSLQTDTIGVRRPSATSSSSGNLDTNAILASFRATYGVYYSPWGDNYYVSSNGCTTLAAWFIGTRTTLTYGRGNGGEVAKQLVSANPTKLSLTPRTSAPRAGSIFSSYSSKYGASGAYGHVGLVTAVDGNKLTILETWAGISNYVQSRTIDWSSGDAVDFVYVGGYLR